MHLPDDMNQTPNYQPNGTTPSPSEQTETNLSRGEFVRSLGLSSAALMALYCMGTLTACKGSDPVTPAPPVTPPPTGGSTGLTGNTTTAGGAINFTLDLNNATYAPLKTVGGFDKVGDVLVINAKGGNYVALQRLCTAHGLDQLSYQLSTDDIQCSHQGSQFNTDGSVKKQPAASALKKYTATLVGNILTVKA